MPIRRMSIATNRPEEQPPLHLTIDGARVRGLHIPPPLLAVLQKARDDVAHDSSVKTIKNTMNKEITTRSPAICTSGSLNHGNSAVMSYPR